MYVLLAGFLPFDEQTMPQLFEKIQSASYQFPSWFSESVRDMLGKILVTDSKARLKIGDLKKHRWFTDEGKLPEDAPAIPVESEGNAVEEDVGETSVKVDANIEGDGDGDGVTAASATTEASNASEAATSGLSEEEAQKWITRTQSESKVKRVFQFKSRGDPAVIVKGISECLGEMECEMKIFEVSDEEHTPNANMTPHTGRQAHTQTVGTHTN